MAEAIAPARPAATVILLRRAVSGCEVLLVRRLANAAAFADVFVFPGGVVRADDFAVASDASRLTPAEAWAELTERGGNPPADAVGALACIRAGIRELFEEAGVLLATDERGVPAHTGEALDRWSKHRQDLQLGRRGLIEILREEHLQPDDRQLRYFSHWITPANAPRRFDTRFFVAELPSGQAAVHCRIETTESVWISPRGALDRHAAGSLPLVLPTRMHLLRLAAYASCEEIMDFARTKAIQTINPTRQSDAEIERIGSFDETAAW